MPLLIRLPVEAAHPFGREVGCRIELFRPGHPVAGPLQHMDFLVENFDELENFEQTFLVLTKGGKALRHGLGVSLGIVELEHFGRAGGPGLAPLLHEQAQAARRAVVRPGDRRFIHVFGQHYGRAGAQAGADRINILEADGHAALGIAGIDAVALAVNPDAVTGLAAQLVHRIGIVQGIGNAAVFLEIQAACNLVLHKVDAFGRAQIVDDLLVAGDLSRGAGEGILQLERAFVLEKEKGLALLVHRHQMRGQTFVIDGCLPVVRPGEAGTPGKDARYRRHVPCRRGKDKRQSAYQRFPARGTAGAPSGARGAAAVRSGGNGSEERTNGGLHGSHESRVSVALYTRRSATREKGGRLFWDDARTGACRAGISLTAVERGGQGDFLPARNGYWRASSTSSLRVKRACSS